MKRWFIARLDEYEGPGDRGPKVVLYGRNGELLDDQNTVPLNFRIWSRPGFGWCFGQLAAQSMTTMQEDPDIFILPDGAMDMSVGSIPTAVRSNLRTRLENAGFEFGDVRTNWTVRQLLNYLLQQLQPIPSVESGDVPDSD